jgi:beta-lactamase superfamily II metal-dependent hydrolase
MLINTLQPFPKKEKVVYGKVIDIEKFSDLEVEEYSVTIDLINDEMIEYDKNLDLDDSNQIEEFKPYFYYLNLHIKKQGLIDILNERKDKTYFEYKLMRAVDSGEFRLEDDEIKGMVYFSASPTSVKEYIIKITNNIVSTYSDRTLPSSCFYSDKNVLEAELNTIFPTNINVKEIKIFHVGQGHNSTIALENGDKGFFDIGYTRFHNIDRSHKRNKLNFKEINWTIISHWDLDHYLGITLLKNIGGIINKPWIGPARISGCNLTRLLNIIYCKSGKKLILIDESLQGVIYTNGELVLYKGHGIEKNDSGIVLMVNGANKKFVSLGDLDYKYLDVTQLPFTDLNYLVVPHHGAQMEGSNPFSPINDGIAVIPVGYNPHTWGHPRRETIMNLISRGFKLHRTDWQGEKTLNFS